MNDRRQFAALSNSEGFLWQKWYAYIQWQRPLLRAVAPARKKAREACETKRMEKAVMDEAQRLIHEFGNGAIQELRERLSAARRRRHARLERFLEKVGREIERRAEQPQPNRQRPARK